MNEVPQPLNEQEREGLKANLIQGREALSSEVAAHNAADAARLGHLAAGHEVHADMHGNILTDREVQAVAHGNLAVKE